MRAYTSSPAYETSYILDNYDWEGVGKGLVVDIGGAQGHVGIELAKRFKNLNILIQDMDKVVEQGAAGVPADLASRVKFMAQDFFAPQTVQADVYYFRWILHNWSDKYCILILRAQIPVLKPGARIVIQDTCMPEPGSIARWKEKDLRYGVIARMSGHSSSSIY
jgi:O-methyltransferase domain